MGEGDAGQRGIKERKKWDKCYSIINKIYLKIAKMQNFNIDINSGVLCPS